MQHSDSDLSLYWDLDLSLFDDWNRIARTDCVSHFLVPTARKLIKLSSSWRESLRYYRASEDIINGEERGFIADHYCINYPENGVIKTKKYKRPINRFLTILDQELYESIRHFWEAKIQHRTSVALADRIMSKIDDAFKNIITIEDRAAEIIKSTGLYSYSVDGELGESIQGFPYQIWLACELTSKSYSYPIDISDSPYLNNGTSLNYDAEKFSMFSIEHQFREFLLSLTCLGEYLMTMAIEIDDQVVIPKNMSARKNTNRSKLQLFISGLIKFHAFDDGRVGNWAPVINNQFAQKIGASQSTTSNYFKKYFPPGGYDTYEKYCINNNTKLRDKLSLLSGEHLDQNIALYGNEPPGDSTGLGSAGLILQK